MLCRKKTYETIKNRNEFNLEDTYGLTMNVKIQLKKSFVPLIPVLCVLFDDNVLNFISALHNLKKSGFWMCKNTIKHDKILRSNLFSDKYFQWKDECMSNLHKELDFQTKIKYAVKRLKSSDNSRSSIEINNSSINDIFLINFFLKSYNMWTHELNFSVLISDVTQKNFKFNFLRELVHKNINHLLEFFPSRDLCYLTNDEQHESKLLRNTGIFFLDIVNFSSISEKLTSFELFSYLKSFYQSVDEVTKKYTQLRKIEIAGDSYVVINHRDSRSSYSSVSSDEEQTQKIKPEVSEYQELIDMLLEILELTRKKNVSVRIGIHLGDVTSGIIGVHQPKFTIVGSPMIMASRLQCTSESNCVHMTNDTFIFFNKFLNKYIERLNIIDKGNVLLKGKGFFSTKLLQLK